MAARTARINMTAPGLKTWCFGGLAGRDCSATAIVDDALAACPLRPCAAREARPTGALDRVGATGRETSASPCFEPQQSGCTFWAR